MFNNLESAKTYDKEKIAVGTVRIVFARVSPMVGTGCIFPTFWCKLVGSKQRCFSN